MKERKLDIRTERKGTVCLLRGEKTKKDRKRNEEKKTGHKDRKTSN